MKKSSPEKPRPETLLSQGVQPESAVDVRKLASRPGPGLDHTPMTIERPRGPPDKSQGPREGDS
jgi:hypothetical protein